MSWLTWRNSNDSMRVWHIRFDTPPPDWVGKLFMQGEMSSDGEFLYVKSLQNTPGFKGMALIQDGFGLRLISAATVAAKADYLPEAAPMNKP